MKYHAQQIFVTDSEMNPEVSLTYPRGVHIFTEVFLTGCLCGLVHSTTGQREVKSSE